MYLATADIYRNKFSKNKRYTIYQYKRSFLQSSNVPVTVTSLFYTSPLIMAQGWAKSILEIINYGIFINQFPLDIIRSIRQLEMINKKNM